MCHEVDVQHGSPSLFVVSTTVIRCSAASSASSSINVWRGVPYGPDDGTLAPWAVAASLPFAPEIVLPAFELKVGGYVSGGLTHVVRL